MFIIDAHLDLAWNALQWNRDLSQSAHTIRTREVGTSGKGRAAGTVAVPEMRKGQIVLCFATVLARCTGNPVPGLDYLSPAQAYGIAQGQLAYYHALQSLGEVNVITNLLELNEHIERWESRESATDAQTASRLPIGIIISMESADPVLDPNQLQEWWEDGLRVLGVAHYGQGRYAGGTGTETGLTDYGKVLLSEAERLGMIVDVTHGSDRAFWQTLEQYNGPIIASHNNCRTLVPHQRQFDDDQLRAIFERDGIVGLAFDAWMLQSGWNGHAGTHGDVTIATVVDHIDYVCQLAGSSRHAAVGSDLDGGFGREQAPCDLDTIADLQKLEKLLAHRGYTTDDILAILHGNWLRLLRWAWK